MTCLVSTADYSQVTQMTQVNVRKLRRRLTVWYISVIHHELAESRIRCGKEKLEEVQEPVEWQQGQHPHLGSVLELATKAPRFDFTITEKAPTRDFAWLKARRRS